MLLFVIFFKIVVKFLQKDFCICAIIFSHRQLSFGVQVSVLVSVVLVCIRSSPEMGRCWCDQL